MTWDDDVCYRVQKTEGDERGWFVLQEGKENGVYVKPDATLRRLMRLAKKVKIYIRVMQGELFLDSDQNQGW